MMTRLFSFVLFALILVATQAQGQVRFTIEPRIGYGTFSMGQMKDVQQEIIRNVGVRAKATDQFPAYMHYGFVLAYHLNERSRISLTAETGSTGGRVAYQDYSGNFTSDQLLTYKSFGSFYGREFGSDLIRLMLGLESSIIFSDFKLTTDAAVNEQKDSSEDKFKAIGVGIKPFVGVVVPYKRFESRLTAGYLFNNNEPFYWTDDEEAVLVVNNTEIAPNWSGLRLNLSLGFTIGK